MSQPWYTRFFTHLFWFIVYVITNFRHSPMNHRPLFIKQSRHIMVVISNRLKFLLKSVILTNWKLKLSDWKVINATSKNPFKLKFCEIKLMREKNIKMQFMHKHTHCSMIYVWKIHSFMQNSATKFKLTKNIVYDNMSKRQLLLKWAKKKGYVAKDESKTNKARWNDCYARLTKQSLELPNRLVSDSDNVLILWILYLPPQRCKGCDVCSCLICTSFLLNHKFYCLQK